MGGELGGYKIYARVRAKWMTNISERTQPPSASGGFVLMHISISWSFTVRRITCFQTGIEVGFTDGVGNRGNGCSLRYQIFGVASIDPSTCLSPSRVP